MSLTASTLPVHDAVDLAVTQARLVEVSGLVAVADTLAAERQPVRAAIGLVLGIAAERLAAAMAVLREESISTSSSMDAMDLHMDDPSLAHEHGAADAIGGEAHVGAFPHRG